MGAYNMGFGSGKNVREYYTVESRDLRDPDKKNWKVRGSFFDEDKAHDLRNKIVSDPNFVARVNIEYKNTARNIRVTRIS